MSEWIIETKYLDSDGSSQLTTGRASGRMRSISEVYSIGTPCLDYESQDSRKNSEDGRCSSITSPAPNYGLTPQFSYEKSFENGSIQTGSFASGNSNRSLQSSNETRGRLFSELSISDLPTDGGDDNTTSLDISFPCSYEENMEIRGKAIVQLRQAAIKRVVIRSGARFTRYNIVFTKDHYYWPQETIRHCRTGRIKRGMILKRQFGVYYPDRTKELIALKVMEKSAISESFQWNEDDVQTELSVMKEICESGGHENILYLYDSLETKEYLIAVMELVDGDLHDMLASVKDCNTAISVFSQIIRGYYFLVQKGYFHCDLSLENIAVKLIPNYKNSGKAKLVAKLSDFGRVRKIDENGQSFIEEDDIAGKPYYLAPEAYSGCYDAGPADIWSLGIILYILLTGSPPFGIANDSDEVFEPFSHIGFDYLLPSLNQLNEKPQYIELLRSLLQVNPRKRPTIVELITDPVLSLYQ